jgi:hypothetical protein
LNTFCIQKAKLIDMKRLRYALPLLVLFLMSANSNSQVLMWSDSSGIPINNSSNMQRNPKAVTDGHDGVIVFFESIVGSARVIKAQRCDINGEKLWDTAGVDIYSSPVTKTLVCAVPDNEGGAIIAWFDRKDGDNNSRIYLQRIDSSGTNQWKYGGVELSDQDIHSGFVQCISDGEGGMFVCYEDRTIPSDIDIYIQRISRDGTAVWNASGTAVTTAPGQQRIPRICEAPGGGCYVAYMDEKNAGDINVQFVNASGFPVWGHNGINITNHQAEQVNPRIAALKNGAFTVVWEDSRNSGEKDIYYTVINDRGAPFHVPGGVLLCDPAGEQSLAAVSPDGGGGAIVTWIDFRFSAEGDIFARRINKEGMVRWGSSNGIVIANPTNVQEQPSILGDGYGGAFIAWQDKRDGVDFDLWMQSLDSNGIRRWIYRGIPLVIEEQSQIGLQLVESTPGSVIGVWTDGRIADGLSDIYAERVAYTPVIEFPDSLVYPDQRYGTDSLTRIALRNLGPGPLRITSMFVSGNQSTDFILVEQLPLPYIIPEGDSVMVSIIFRPRGTGYRMSRLYIRGTVDNQTYLHPPYLVALSGYCVQPNFRVFPSRINFAVDKVGQSTDTTLPYCLKNIGVGPLTVYSMVIDGFTPGSFELVNPPDLPFQIAEKDSIGLTFRYTSSINGSQSAFLTMVSDGSTSSRTIYLYGVGGGFPEATIEPRDLVFDTSRGETHRLPLKIRSDNAFPLWVYDIGIEGSHPGDFSIVGFSPREISGGDSIYIMCDFTARGNGERSALMRINTDLRQPDILVSLLGYGKDIVTTSVSGIPSPRKMEVEIFPNPQSTIGFVRVELSRAASSSIRIYNSLGMLVHEIHDSYLDAGMHSFSWNPAMLPAGIYFCIVQSGLIRNSSHVMIIR